MNEQKKTVSVKMLHWLLEEIESWRKEGVVSPEQAGQLKSRYQEQYEIQQKSRPDYMIMIISIVGALLVGAGVILFFAYNWDKIPKEVRTGTILLAMTVFYLVGYYIREKFDAYRYLGESFLFIGTMLFGSGIWLIAQMYNINAHYPNGWLFWAIGAIAVSYSTESISINMLASVLLAIWTNTESMGFDHPNLWYLPAVAIGIFPFVYQSKSRHALAVALISLIIGFFGSVCGSANYFLINLYIALGCLLFLTGLLHYSKDSSHPFASIYLKMSQIVLIIVMFIATFYDLHHGYVTYEKPISSSVYWVLGGEFLLGIILLFYNSKKIYSSNLLMDQWMHKICLIFPAIILLSACTTTFFLKTESGETYALLVAILWNAIFLCLAFSLLYSGQILNQMSLMYAGTVVLILEAIGRYFDLFDNMLHRSVYFLIAGGLFIYYGFWLAKKRKTIKSMNKEIVQ